MRNVIIKHEGVEQPLRGLGDVVERLAKPIAKALNMPCLDENKRLRPESPCAKRRDALNRMLPFGPHDPADNPRNTPL